MLLLAFASCKSCKKDVAPVNQLPPETQTGANTAGFLIDGVAWIPSINGSGALGSRPMGGGYFSSAGTPKNTVWLRMYRNDRTSMQLWVRAVDKPGRYPLSFDTGIDIAQPNTRNFGLYAISGNTISDPDYNYITTSIKAGYVNFTVADTLTGSLAGTFEFDAIDNPSGKTIKVTGGRFDINTITLNK